MHGAVKRRLLWLTVAMFAIGLAAAPVSYAGEDEDGTTDGGSAGGGVASGAGGMSASSGDDFTAELLAGAGLLVLGAGGLAYRRRSNDNA
jgi:hypothetical protein